MHSEEFREVALTVYRLFGRPLEEEKENYIDRIADRKFELQKLIGHTVADAKLREVASLAQRLLNLQPSNNNSATSCERSLDADENLEFGADLVFQAPARFLVDVSLDDGDMMDLKALFW